MWSLRTRLHEKRRSWILKYQPCDQPGLPVGKNVLLRQRTVVPSWNSQDAPRSLGVTGRAPRMHHWKQHSVCGSMTSEEFIPSPRHTHTHTTWLTVADIFQCPLLPNLLKVSKYQGSANQTPAPAANLSQVSNRMSLAFEATGQKAESVSESAPIRG